MTDLMERPWFVQSALLLTSLACGIGVWVSVQLTEREEQTLLIPVVPIKTESQVDLSLQPQRVSVKFSYPAIESALIRPENFRVEVDFSNYRDRIGARLTEKGDRTLNREMVQFGVNRERYNISVVDMITPQVSWTGRLRSREAVIRPVLTGEPAPGYQVDANRATIDGASTLVVLLTEEKEKALADTPKEPLVIGTLPIDVSGKKGILRERAVLALPPGVSLLSDNDLTERTVVIPIEEKTITRTLESVPVKYQFVSLATDLEATIEPATVTVTITGKLTAVNAIGPDGVTFGLFGVAEVPGESREIALETQVTRPELRPDVLAITTEPKTVVVRITRKGQTTSPEAAPPGLGLNPIIK